MTSRKRTGRGHALKNLPDVECPECGKSFRPQGVGNHRKNAHPETFEPGYVARNSSMFAWSNARARNGLWTPEEPSAPCPWRARRRPPIRPRGGSDRVRVARAIR